jgi:parvulin-like peptidyl-prolyl isomerase
LVNILLKSQPQQLSQPTQIGNVILIVRLEKILPAQLDRSMRQRLLNERFNQWLQTQMTEQNCQIKSL